MKKTITLLTSWLCIFLFPFGVASASDKLEEATIKLSNRAVLKMKSKPFIPVKHKITTCKVLNWRGTCLIDGKPFFGTDLDVPISQLVEATVVIDGSTKVNLDVSSMFNPWTGKPRRSGFKITKVEVGWVVHGEFSDGAGSYEAEWLVVSVSSVRTKLQNTGE